MLISTEEPGGTSHDPGRPARDIVSLYGTGTHDKCMPSTRYLKPKPSSRGKESLTAPQQALQNTGPLNGGAASRLQSRCFCVTDDAGRAEVAGTQLCTDKNSKYLPFPCPSSSDHHPLTELPPHTEGHQRTPSMLTFLPHAGISSFFLRRLLTFF